MSGNTRKGRGSPMSENTPDASQDQRVPDFLKRMTGALPPLKFPEWRDDGDGREGRREGAEED